MKIPNKTQIKHLLRFLKQSITKVEIGVLGAYHGGNLGDMALGKSVQQALNKQNIPGSLQTIFNLEKWPKATKAIIGGGAIGDKTTLEIIVKRYNKNFKNVAIIGVDFNDTLYPKEVLRLIKEASYVSCRSIIQSEKLTKISNRKDIEFHPDIAFSFEKDFCKNYRISTKQRTEQLLLVNVIPMYGYIENGKIKSNLKFKSERPELYEGDVFKRMHENYKNIITDKILAAIKDGFRVETIPFTPEDEEYGKIIFKGLPIKHTRYDSNPNRVLKKMATAKLIISTRLHTTIFALKLGKPVLPIAYAYKNVELLESLGIDKSKYVSSWDLSVRPMQFPEALPNLNKQISIFENQSNDALNRCIESIKF